MEDFHELQTFKQSFLFKKQNLPLLGRKYSLGEIKLCDTVYFVPKLLLKFALYRVLTLK